MEGNSKNIRNWLKLVRTQGVGSTIFIRLLTADYTDDTDFNHIEFDGFRRQNKELNRDF